MCLWNYMWIRVPNVKIWPKVFCIFFSRLSIHFPCHFDFIHMQIESFRTRVNERFPWECMFWGKSFILKKKKKQQQPRKKQGKTIEKINKTHVVNYKTRFSALFFTWWDWVSERYGEWNVFLTFAPIQ